MALMLGMALMFCCVLLAQHTRGAAGVFILSAGAVLGFALMLEGT